MLRYDVGASLIITEEMYGMDWWLRRELERWWFKKKKVILNTEAALERLERIVGQQQAAMLAKAAALMPWLADGMEKDLQEVRKRLDNLIRLENSGEVCITIENVLKGNSKYHNRQLAIGLGIIDDTGPKRRGNGLSSFGGRLKVNEKVGDLQNAKW